MSDAGTSPAPAAAPAEPQLEWIDGRFTYPLDKEILGEGKSFKTLVLRQPNTGDIAAVGNPVAYNPFPKAGEQTVNFNDERMVNMISRLSELPPSTIKQMEPGDYTDIAWSLASFFVPRVLR